MNDSDELSIIYIYSGRWDNGLEVLMRNLDGLIGIVFQIQNFRTVGRAVLKQKSGGADWLKRGSVENVHQGRLSRILP